MEAIILAGGLGTRLREKFPDLPKCLVTVAGKPFLFFIINQLRKQGIEKFIFSLGYKSSQILEYLENHFPSLDYCFTIEKEPLGTGGAIKLALSKSSYDNVIITNGDTIFKSSIGKLVETHIKNSSDCTILTKSMKNFDRYGKIEINNKNRITKFNEKGFYKNGLINAGTYLLNRYKFQNCNLPEIFSFEKDFLESRINSLNFYAAEGDGYFIDIGIPSDYEIANVELKSKPFDVTSVDKKWTVFLDRDGVINKEIGSDYVRTVDEFQFYPGALDAIKSIQGIFGRTIVVTNQRGVGKKIMSIEDLNNIHSFMLSSIIKSGGNIDAIFCCTSINEKDINRKPNPGMAFQALEKLPDIDLEKSIMVGNKLSDMEFARNAGMYSVFITTTNPEVQLPHPDIDLAFDSLLDFSKYLKHSKAPFLR